ncbi:Lrp/AsnC family transcriptional regulator [Stackebrandtia nassauensis]|uniref:Transcriptional regulator, AsnC family n=1 Tax=Stackebrandtia nassauensis (strain DSM 44728 / CIP 108903 / NRRL B-16338 / NBRC 102104 / LLR-40K-21) TaxID=446470 RepID=D3PWY9_STANL|nr:Lrp/AsnC family transcriptional regulator [Stackebrandtia nassauensis]ADD45213.1 transcriptional regulator, AsnC family [Stackebrandtia nassauensis DSM 44728]
MDSVTIDGLDRELVHALQIDGRAPFSRIAEVLDVSDQTVSRRYRRLRSHGVLRVVGRGDVSGPGRERWHMRIHCVPDAALGVARALARRPDTAWTDVVSGGTEVNCVVQTPNRADRDALLLDALPRSPRVTSMSAHCLLHTYFGGAGEHARVLAALSPAQERRLRPRPATGAPLTPDTVDRAILAELGQDGRCELSRLARAADCSESTARRRLELLRDSGCVFYDLDLDTALLGFTVTARLWLRVAPSDLDAVGAALATHPEVGFAAATTGPHNLIAAVVCRDGAHLYEYVSKRLGGLTAIQHVETAPVIRPVKGSATPWDMP